MMPLFSLIGGLAVFAWSRRLYGSWGGLLSLALWVFCPNILAHARLVTSDLGATAIGVGGDLRFLALSATCGPGSGPLWRESPWDWRCLPSSACSSCTRSGRSSGWSISCWRFRTASGRAGSAGALWERSSSSGAACLVIDAGYFFEGVGIPLGDFEFGSRSLTRQVAPGTRRPKSLNPLFDITWQFRVNRFRGTWLARLPMPLPEHYLTGFDEQKIETEGIPEAYSEAWLLERSQPGAIAARARRSGALRREIQWLSGLSRWRVAPRRLVVLLLPCPSLQGAGGDVAPGGAIGPRARVHKANDEDWSHEIALLTVPAVIIVSISFLTDINLGLRYILPIAPYAFIATGKICSVDRGSRAAMERLMISGCGLLLRFDGRRYGLDSSPLPGLFQLGLGRPRPRSASLDRQQPRLGTGPGRPARVVGENHSGRSRSGLVYFGQINPSIFAVRGRSFSAGFLPPPLPGTTHGPCRPRHPRCRPRRSLTPGYYAVSATALYGLPWRYYDPAPLTRPRKPGLRPGTSATMSESRRLRLLPPIPADRPADRAFDLYLSLDRRRRGAGRELAGLPGHGDWGEISAAFRSPKGNFMGDCRVGS